MKGWNSRRTVAQVPAHTRRVFATKMLPQCIASFGHAGLTASHAAVAPRGSTWTRLKRVRQAWLRQTVTRRGGSRGQSAPKIERGFRTAMCSQAPASKAIAASFPSSRQTRRQIRLRLTPGCPAIVDRSCAPLQAHFRRVFQQLCVSWEFTGKSHEPRLFPRWTQACASLISGAV